MAELAVEAEVWDDDVIRPLSNVYRDTGGIAVLRGNLCPDGAVVKQSAVSDKMRHFRGTALCFDDRIPDGSWVIVRYEGPRGGPGMREMLSPTSALTGMGKEESVALLTDGRFSGGTRGPADRGRRRDRGRSRRAHAQPAGGRGRDRPSARALGGARAEDHEGLAGALREAGDQRQHRRGDEHGVRAARRGVT